jgi:hypothetical protein
VEAFTPGRSESYSEREGRPLLRTNQQHPRIEKNLLKQEINKQRKHRAQTGNKEVEEAHNHSPMKNAQRKTTEHSHPGPK